MAREHDFTRGASPAPRSELEIPVELQAAWIRQLRWHFDHINYQYLRQRLQRPLFQLSVSREKLGEWNGARRTLTISIHHILSHSWEAVLDTLRHEMAHQYVHECMNLPHAPAHGGAFAEACRILRCDPKAATRTETLERLEDSRSGHDRILQRVKELLALAGSPNEHEAASAMRMAQKYLLKYNLELSELEGRREYEVRHFGRSAPRIQEYECTLSTILQDHFFVLTIWTFSYEPLRNIRGRVLQACGTPRNLDIAEYVHGYVMRLAEDLWKERRRILATMREPGRRGTKLQYLAGLLRGLKDKLDRQKVELRDEHGLIWTGDNRLTEFYRYVNPRIASGGASGVRRNSQYAAGLEDGEKIQLRAGLTGAGRKRGLRLTEPSG